MLFTFSAAPLRIISLQTFRCLFYNIQRNISTNIITRTNKYQNLWTEDSSLLFKMPRSREVVTSTESSSSEDEKPKKELKKEKKKLKRDRSESSDDEPKKKPSSSKKSNSKATDEEQVWNLGNMREVKVREFKGKPLIDIREMYLDKDGETKPGRKGISLSPAQFFKLVQCIGEVEEAVKAKT